MDARTPREQVPNQDAIIRARSRGGKASEDPQPHHHLGRLPGIIYEADARHEEIVVNQLGLQDAKPVTSPGAKEEGRTKNGMEEPLRNEEASTYMALVARCNYLAPDRPDIAYSVKELARQMATPAATAA